MVKTKHKHDKLLKNIGRLTTGLLLVILLWQYNQNRTVTLHYLDHQGATRTLALPLKDRNRLAQLMQKLFAENSFAYTILGSKPASWETYYSILPLCNWPKCYEAFSKHNRVLRSGWKTWKKYQHLFPTVRMWSESSKNHPGVISILIVNEDRFNDVVTKNTDVFHQVLGIPIEDGMQLLQKAKNCSLMHDVLAGHQALIGIVLGYGRGNSWQFFENCENRLPSVWVWEEEANPFLESANSNSNLIEHYLTQYSCPTFAGNPHSEESLALKQEYLLIRQKILTYYKGKDFLEATLSLLSNNKFFNFDCLEN